MNQKTSLFFRLEKNFVRIPFDSILYMAADKNYTHIVTAKKTYKILDCLGHIEKELPETEFCRVHRSFIVRLDAITAFDYLTIMLGEEEVPLGYSFRKALTDKLPIHFNNARLKNSFMTLRLRDLMPTGENNN